MNNLNIQNAKFKKGFTLIELSLFMGLFSIILLVLTTIFGELIHKQFEIQSTSAVESDKSYILSRLEYDLSRSDLITIPVASGDASTELELEINGSPYSYQLNGAVLEVRNNGEVFRLNNARTEISNLSFQRLGNTGGTSLVKVNMTITSIVKESSGQRNTAIDTTIGIR